MWELLEVQSLVLSTMFNTSLPVKVASELHRPIVEAIKIGDVERVREAVINHYRVVRQYYNP